jgi:hypothetical protein
MGLGSQPLIAAALSPEMTQDPLYRRLCGALELVRKSAENLALTGIRTLERRACNFDVYSQHLSEITKDNDE